MSNERTKIREAVAARLSAEDTIAAKVFTNRKLALPFDTMPVIIVSSPKEQVSRMAQAPKIYERRLTLTIDALATANDDLDDVLDSLASQIERCLEHDDTLGRLVRSLDLNETALAIDAEGQKLAGSVRLVYEAIYHTDETQDGDFTELGGLNVRLVQ